MERDDFAGIRPGDPTAARLLRAASDMVGGNKALSERLKVSQAMLIKYMAGGAEVPPALVLGAVDILLAEREPRLEPGAE